MNVVDSSGWLEFFADGANADVFAEPLRDLNNVLVPVISLYEVFKVIVRQRSEVEALKAMSFMQQGIVITISPFLAMEAAKNSLRYKLPMADAFILTTAKQSDALLWTQDVDFKGINGVRFIPKW